MQINVAVSANRKFLTPLKVMLFSLYKNNSLKTTSINVFFLNSGLSSQELNDLRRFIRNQIHGHIMVINIDEPLFSKYATDLFSKETFNRLLLPYVLPAKIKKVLWLDCDMIINGNILDFYNQSLNDYYLLATKDSSPNIVDIKKSLGIPLEQDYFNAGGILLNIEKIRSEVPKTTILDYISKNGALLKYKDQDVLNVLLASKALVLQDDIYNNMQHLKSNNSLPNACIIHFISFMKPWKYYYQGYGDNYYWEYAGKCGFIKNKIIYRLLHPFASTSYKLYHHIIYH